MSLFERPKNFFSKNEKDIVLGLGMALIVIIAMGIGRLTAGVEPKIIIENAETTSARALRTALDKSTDRESKDDAFVASMDGKVYHRRASPWAERIKPENRIFFHTEEEAQAAGYRRSKDFEKYAPP